MPSSSPKKAACGLNSNSARSTALPRMDLLSATPALAYGRKTKTGFFKRSAKLAARARVRTAPVSDCTLSQKLAELLGGTITFESEYGKGARFQLSLPEGQGDR